MAMTETPEERARRLGLTAETPEERARRLGVDRPTARPAMVSADATRALQRERPDATGDYEAGAPAVLGSAASLLRDFPGGEATQAAVRSLVRRQPYREAREDIRMAEDAAPAVASGPARLAGATISALALPGGMAAQGALHGVLNSALDSDVDRGARSRAAGAVVGGLTEGALGGAGALGKALYKAPPGAMGEVAGELFPKAANAMKKWRALNAAVAPKAIEAPSQVAGSIAPKVEGLMDNGMDNVLEAVKANQAPKNVVADVVKATQRYRSESGALQRRGTNARFDWFANRGAEPPPSVAPRPAMPTDAGSALDDNLEELLRRSVEMAKRKKP